MKSSFFAFCAVIPVSALPAADSSLNFGEARIGIPPLSLSESSRSRTPGQWKLIPEVRSFSAEAPGPNLTPNLVPRFGPSLDEVRTAAQARKPRVTTKSGMPVFEPSDAIDFRMKVQAPDPSMDFKLVIKVPGDPATK